MRRTFEYLDGASQTVVVYIDVVAIRESAIEESIDIDLKVEIKDMAFDGLIGPMTSNQNRLLSQALRTKGKELSPSFF